MEEYEITFNVSGPDEEMVKKINEYLMVVIQSLPYEIASVTTKKEYLS